MIKSGGLIPNRCFIFGNNLYDSLFHSIYNLKSSHYLLYFIHHLSTSNSLTSCSNSQNILFFSHILFQHKQKLLQIYWFVFLKLLIIMSIVFLKSNLHLDDFLKNVFAMIMVPSFRYALYMLDLKRFFFLSDFYPFKNWKEKDYFSLSWFHK